MRSVLSIPYPILSYPGSVNVRDCVKDDAQIALRLLDLILIFEDVVRAIIKKCLSLPITIGSSFHILLTSKPEFHSLILLLLVSLIGLVEQNILKTFPNSTSRSLLIRIILLHQSHHRTTRLEAELSLRRRARSQV